jgi:hypothetical protein
LIQSLDNYSICVRHYNQIITSNILLERLKAGDNSISSSLEEGQRKRSRVVTIDEDAEGQKIEDTSIISEYQQKVMNKTTEIFC